MTRKHLFWYILLILALSAPLTVQAADAIVGTGTAASCTEAAFDAALNTVKTTGGGTITFSCGGPKTIIFTAQKSITSNVTLDGGNLITLSGGSAVRLFHLTGTLSMRNIVLTNGFSNADGGAIVNQGTLTLDRTTIRNSNTSSAGSGGAIVSYGPLTITNSRFENNGAANGGALYLRFEAADALITSSLFINNRTTDTTNGWGGAILLWDGADVTVRATVFDQNQANIGGAFYNQFANSNATFEQLTVFTGNTTTNVGGAIYNYAGTVVVSDGLLDGNGSTQQGEGAVFNDTDGTVTIFDTTISNNTATNYGGGLFTRYGSVELERVLFSGNSAQIGGGLFSQYGPLYAANVTFSNNTTTGNGTAIYHQYGDGNLRHVTMQQNRSSSPGNSSLLVGWGTLSLKNVIIAQTGADYRSCQLSPFGQIISLGNNISSDGTCFFAEGGDRNNIDPLLGSLADNGGPTHTHMPLANSPAIDGGPCLAGIAVDQRGYQRPAGAACDIGAVEVGAIPTAVMVRAISAETTSTPILTGFTLLALLTIAFPRRSRTLTENHLDNNKLRRVQR